MILSIKWQVLIFFMSIAIGFLIGFFYDLIRVFRRIFKHINLLVQIEDFVYWIFSAIFVFFITLYENKGEVRAFFILGVFLGMILYFCTISILFIKVSNEIIKFFKKVFIITFKIIYIPIKTTLKVFSYPCKFIYKKLLNINKYLNKLLKKNKIYVKIKSNSIFKKKSKTKEGVFNEEQS